MNGAGDQVFALRAWQEKPERISFVLPSLQGEFDGDS